jgi:hypothetical protein
MKRKVEVCEDHGDEGGQGHNGVDGDGYAWSGANDQGTFAAAGISDAVRELRSEQYVGGEETEGEAGSNSLKRPGPGQDADDTEDGQEAGS